MSEGGFAPDPAFAPGSVHAADWPLCHVRLQDDARFPWLVLIPRRPGALHYEAAALAEVLARITA